MVIFLEAVVLGYMRIHNLQHFLSAHCSWSHGVLSATITFVFTMFSFRSICLLPLDSSSSSSSHFCAGQHLTPHNHTLEVRPGRITKKLELKYVYDCERDTKSLLGVLMLGSDIVIANNE